MEQKTIIVVNNYNTNKKMNLFSQFKIFLKLFPAMLVVMLGVGHSIVELSSLINHTTVSVFRFRFEPTLWTFFVTLFVTIAALVITIKIMLKRRL